MKNLLKFITCGSVDDGKSTLIGHILYDAKLLFADQKKALLMESKIGSRDGKIDYSLLLDGLLAEREQGITIDVAYRFFSTEKRSFIVADTPGHEEYTRNMAVGASFADLAVILVDATHGVLTQTKRHTRICSMMGIKHFLFAVNKMDLVNYDRKFFYQINEQINEMISAFSYKTVGIIPVSATEGDNVINVSDRMNWYEGPAVLDYIESIEISEGEDKNTAILPIQRVCRPNHDFRGFQGEIASGKLSVGDRVYIYPSGESSIIKTIINGDRTVLSAKAGNPVNICLEDEIDVSRGSVISNSKKINISNTIEADILWMDDEDLKPSKNYLLRIGTQKVPAIISQIVSKTDINTGEKKPAREVKKNELATCIIVADSKIAYECFDECNALGSLILIDRLSHTTSACGVIKNINSNNNLFWQNTDITRELREQHLGQRALTVWLTGLSGSGKSTIANALEKRLFIDGKATMILDGDNIRMGLNKDLGFGEDDRAENIRRVAEVSKLMNDAGIIVIVSFISPFKRERLNARQIVGDSFREVYVKTSLKECIRRDTKGLYRKALDGEIKNFTGIDSPYEAPANAEIEINTEELSVEECVDEIMNSIFLYEETGNSYGRKQKYSSYSV